MEFNLSHLNKHLTGSVTVMTPPGHYPATILDASVESSKNGNPQIVYQLDVEINSPKGLVRAVIYKFTQLIEPMIEFFLDEMTFLEIKIRVFGKEVGLSTSVKLK